MRSTTHLKRGAGLMVAAAVLVPTLAACGSSSGSSAAKKPATSSSTAPAASGDTVNIKLIAYKPGTLTVSAGSTVTWHQMDPGVHTVTSGTVQQNGGSVTPMPDGMFMSGQIATGKTYSHSFDAPGTSTYFCEIHPATMHGEITVR